VIQIAALQRRQRRIQRGLDALAAEARRRGMSFTQVANGAVAATGDPATTNAERRRLSRRLRVRLFRRNARLRSTRCSPSAQSARSSASGGSEKMLRDYDDYGKVRRIILVDYDTSDEELADADLGDAEDDVDDDDEMDDHEGP
jgi:hypothetical protein